MIGIGASYYDRATLVGKYETKRSLFLGKLTADSFNNQDSFDFSNAGRRLNILYNGQKIEKAGRSWEPVLGADIRSDELRRADRNIAKAGKLLEQMLEIAEAAQDPALSDHKRILLQMELGYMQHELDHSIPVAGGSNYHLKADGYLRNAGKQYEDTDSYKMLARALSRIVSGEEWDVAEVRNTILEARPGPEYGWLSGSRPAAENGEASPAEEAAMSYDDARMLYNTKDEWIDHLKRQRPEWDNDNTYFEKPSWGMPADNEDLTLSAAGYVWTVKNDKTLPTVGEVLKGKGRSVMDREAAMVTAEELKREIKGLEKQRKYLVSLAEEYAEVQNKPDDNLDKQVVHKKISDFIDETLPCFFNTLYRESFQFTFGEKYNVFGETLEEYEAKVRTAAQAGRAIVLPDLSNGPKPDGVKVHPDLEIQIPDKFLDKVDNLDEYGDNAQND